MESKILELGKKQREKGYRGGVFTPGSVRSETEYSYRAINTTLETLIDKGLVEKTVTSAIRDGSVVELDVYKITNEGMACIERVASGEVKVTGSEPYISKSPKSEPRKYSKPWEDKPTPKRHWETQPPAPEIAQSIKSLEDAVSAINADLKALHEKMDIILNAQTAPAEPSAPAKPRIPRSSVSQTVLHRLLILESVVELEVQTDNVLADDLKERYAAKCSESGVSPKGMSQFTPLLKRLEAEGIISLQRVGCKNLGIKGQGSRVVVKSTEQGKAFLASHD